jgi:CheY-like chemotaxis protein
MRQNPAARAVRRARPHVYVLDADPAILDLVRELLLLERYDVTASTYAPESLEVIDLHAPDLVVLDLAWGERAGWDLLEALAGHVSTAGIPVLVTSTNHHLLERAVADPARYGTHRDLIKPFDVEVLLALVQELAGVAEAA